VIARGGLRDLITQTHGITQEPGEAIVSVGTAHRLKGLEFDTVILALVDQSPDDKALYIGVSRAVNELIVVGSKAVGERLGLIQPSDGDAD
jgi:superfamily I DNA/RNA helicase